MNDKSKLKTRAPSSQFLEETKPPEFVPRARAKKNRAWYRPDEDEVESAPVAAAEPIATVLVQDKKPSADEPLAVPVRLKPPASQAPKVNKKPLQSAPKVEVGEEITQAHLIEKPLERPTEPPLQTIQIAVAEPLEDPTPAKPRQGASAQANNFEPLHLETISTPIEAEPLSLPPMSDRAQALISRAKSGCPHEYLFRQIMMFEMSQIDSSQDFGTLALSRNGLEQLFGISEGGVKKAKREMESYKLISTISLGTRGSPTVFKIFSPYKTLDKQN